MMDVHCRDVRDVVTSGIFVVCFSESGNDLSQWRAYGGSIGGAAIEFEGHDLARAPNGMILLPVVYSPAFKRDLMDDYILSAESLFLEKLESLHTKEPKVNATIVAIQYCPRCLEIGLLAALALKHSKFHHEKEWRLVYRLRGKEDIRNFEFIPRETLISLHLPMSFAEKGSSDGKPGRPVKGLIVGPTAHPKYQAMVATEILRKNGYDPSLTKVISSKIPFRPSR